MTPVPPVVTSQPLQSDPKPSSRAPGNSSSIQMPVEHYHGPDAASEAPTPNLQEPLPYKPVAQPTEVTPSPDPDLPLEASTLDFYGLLSTMPVEKLTDIASSPEPDAASDVTPSLPEPLSYKQAAQSTEVAPPPEATPQPKPPCAPIKHQNKTPQSKPHREVPDAKVTQVLVVEPKAKVPSKRPKRASRSERQDSEKAQVVVNKIEAPATMAPQTSSSNKAQLPPPTKRTTVAQKPKPQHTPKPAPQTRQSTSTPASTFKPAIQTHAGLYSGFTPSVAAVDKPHPKTLSEAKSAAADVLYGGGSSRPSVPKPSYQYAEYSGQNNYYSPSTSNSKPSYSTGYSSTPPLRYRAASSGTSVAKPRYQYAEYRRQNDYNSSSTSRSKPLYSTDYSNSYDRSSFYSSADLDIFRTGGPLGGGQYTNTGGAIGGVPMGPTGGRFGEGSVSKTGGSLGEALGVNGRAERDDERMEHVRRLLQNY